MTVKEQNDMKNLLERYLNGETSVEEEDRLNVFLHQPDVPEAFLPYRQMFDAASQPNDVPDDAALDTFARDNGIERKRRTTLLSLTFRGAAMAAAAIMLFMAGYHFNDNDIPQPTVKEKTVSVTKIVRDTVKEMVPVVVYHTVGSKAPVAKAESQQLNENADPNSTIYNVAVTENHTDSHPNDVLTILSDATVDVNATMRACAEAQACAEKREMANVLKLQGNEIDY